MMSDPPLAKTLIGLKECVLLRLSAAGKSVSPDQLTDALGPLYISPLELEVDQWNHALETVVGELKREHLVSFASSQVTRQGHELLRDFLGLHSPPDSERWATLRNRYLIAKALGVCLENDSDWQRLGTADGLRVAVMVQGYELPVSPVVSVSECLDELARRQLSRTTTTSDDDVFARDQVLSTRLMPGLSGKPERVLPMLLTEAVDDSPESIRTAVLQNWVRRLNGVEARKPSESGFDLKTFSQRVQHAGELVELPRYGESKVFIQHVWDVFRKQSDETQWSLADFKQRLVEANRENLVTLSRADLVGVMDLQLIQASEIRLPHATFHFVRLQSSS